MVRQIAQRCRHDSRSSYCGTKRSLNNVASSSGTEDRQNEYNDLIEHLTHEDFVKYGLIPEFMCLPVAVPFKLLEEDDLYEILWKPKNSSVVRACLRRHARHRAPGARGLRTIMESIESDKVTLLIVVSTVQSWCSNGKTRPHNSKTPLSILNTVQSTRTDYFWSEDSSYCVVLLWALKKVIPRVSLNNEQRLEALASVPKEGKREPSSTRQ